VSDEFILNLVVRFPGLIIDESDEFILNLVVRFPGLIIDDIPVSGADLVEYMTEQLKLIPKKN
jgi:hypothetical protein